MIEHVIHGDCTEVLAEDIQAESVDLVVTSPPYDDLRDYHGYQFDAREVLAELLRVVKPGGVAVWVVGDATVKGDKTLTSFRHALAAQELGWRVHDVMIYQKRSTQFTRPNAYTAAFEYMFVFSKGAPKTFNPLLRPGKAQRRVVRERNPDGTRRVPKVVNTPEGKMVTRTNIWPYAVGGFVAQNKAAFKHPAIFPEQLAADHIQSWSNPGDLVLDPMCGSGTTCLVAKQLGRGCIGIDISEEYCELARQRLAATLL